MKASEIAMTICAIDEYAEKHKLTSGQKAWRTRLKNQLLIHQICWAKEEHDKAAKKFFSLINDNKLNLHFNTKFKFRKNAVENLSKARLKLEKLRAIQKN